MSFVSRAIATVGAVIFAAGFSVAHAETTLIGSTVTATLYNPDLQTVLGGPTSAVVGASDPTFPSGSIVGNTTFQIDVTGDQIIYNPLQNVTYGGGEFNGFVFVFSDAPTITGVTLDAASNFTPFDISFTSDSISLNLRANTVSTDSVAILDVSLSGIGNSVPEPATWSLMLAGFAGIAASVSQRRRRRAV